MIAQQLCPERERWRDLLDGVLPDAEQQELAGHLDRCPSCQGALEIQAGGGAWPALARPSRGPRPALESALRVVMDELKDQVNTVPTRCEPIPLADQALDCLNAPEDVARSGRFGSYQVTEVLGRGGMSVVLKAFDPPLNRYVALKVLAPQLASSAAARRRFAREGRAAAAVCHEHVVAVHAVDTAGALPYLVMQCVPGISLQERLDRTGPLELCEILRIGMQTASGLAAAHAQGLIHRDVKPGNILLENGIERVLLTDFGLARAADDASLTQSGVLAGTPQYMAPEQSRGETLDHRADLFSLGSVLYAMCTGRTPFRASTTLAVLRRVAEETPRPIASLNKAIPEWLIRIVDKLHAKDPSARYQSAAEVAQLLAQCLAHVQSPEAVPLPASLQTSTAGAIRPPWYRRRWCLAVAAVFLLGTWLAVSKAEGARDVLSFLLTTFHIQTPDGTLAIEVNDPQVKVTVDGAGRDILINGPGFQELRLHPGTYTVQGTKEGAEAYEKVITLKRGERQLVKITMQPASSTTLPATLSAQGNVRIHLESAADAFSPDGNTLATVGADGTIRLWDAASGRQRVSVRGHKGHIISFKVIHDGNILATLDEDGAVNLLNLATGRVVDTQQLHHAVRTGAIAPDGRRILTITAQPEMRLWDARSGKELATRDIDAAQVTAMAFSPDGKLVATTGPTARVRLWDTSGDSMPSGPPELRAIPLVGRLFDVSDSDPLRAPGFDAGGGARALAFSPNGGSLAAGGADGQLVFWNVATRRRTRALQWNANLIEAVAFSPDGKRLASGTKGGLVRLWNVSTGRVIADYSWPNTQVASVVFSPDGMQLILVSVEGTIRMHDLRFPEPVGELKRDERRTIPTAPLPAPSQDRTERQGSLGRIERLTLAGHTGPVTAVTFSPDGKQVVSGSVDRTARIWDAATGRELRTPLVQDAAIAVVAFTADGQQLVTGGADGAVRFWDVTTGIVPLTLSTKSGVRALALSSDNHYIACLSADDKVRVWEMGTSRITFAFNAEHGGPHCLAFSPDASRLVIGSEGGTIRMLDAATGQVVAQHGSPGKPVRTLAFSPDGKRLAAGGSDQGIVVWDVATGKEVSHLRGHHGEVTALAFAPDGRRLASGSADEMILVWDFASGQQVMTLRGHRGGVTGLAFSPDGKTLASSAEDKTVRIWIAVSD